MFPVGTAGDVFPFLGLGQALRERGHQVTILTSGYFKETVERAGFDFVDVLPRDTFLELTANPTFWHPRLGIKTILETFGVRKSYQATVDRYEAGKTIVVTSCLGLGPRVARDHLGIPLVTVDLQPVLLWSAHQTPALPCIVRAGVPPVLRNFEYLLGDKLLFSRWVGSLVNPLRKELGLPPVTRAWEWWHSPDCILGVWPEWFAPPQPDWPAQVRLTQFPLWTEHAGEPLPEEVADFLAVDDPPIVFTPGTAYRFGRDFFAAAAEACQLLGRRGMLFSKFDEHIPARLPDGVRHFRYAPFQKLLPHVAAISHHGGIGTVANALSAGIPQLIMPYGFDQPDNAERLKNLNVGDTLRPRRYRGPAVAERLNRLLTSREVTEACQAAARKFQGVDPFRESCEVIESILLQERIGTRKDSS